QSGAIGDRNTRNDKVRPGMEHASADVGNGIIRVRIIPAKCRNENVLGNKREVCRSCQKEIQNNAAMTRKPWYKEHAQNCMAGIGLVGRWVDGDGTLTSTEIKVGEICYGHLELESLSRDNALRRAKDIGGEINEREFGEVGCEVRFIRKYNLLT